jgi:hypothetical protein
MVSSCIRLLSAGLTRVDEFGRRRGERRGRRGWATGRRGRRREAGGAIRATGHPLQDVTPSPRAGLAPGPGVRVTAALTHGPAMRAFAHRPGRAVKTGTEPAAPASRGWRPARRWRRGAGMKRCGTVAAAVSRTVRDCAGCSAPEAAELAAGRKGGGDPVLNGRPGRSFSQWLYRWASGKDALGVFLQAAAPSIRKSLLGPGVYAAYFLIRCIPRKNTILLAVHVGKFGPSL